MPFRLRTTELSSFVNFNAFENFPNPRRAMDELLRTWDLRFAATRSKLRILSRWKPEQFKSLWPRPDVEMISQGPGASEFGAGIPDCFCSHGLTLDYLSSAGVTVLRKR